MQVGSRRQGQCARNTQGDETSVEPDDEAVVAVDAGHQALGQAAHGHQRLQRCVQDRDVGDRPGDVTRIRQGDRDVRGGEGRGVIDAIPHHDHDMALSAQLSYVEALVLGQHLGMADVDAQPIGNIASARLGITREHDDPFDA